MSSTYMLNGKKWTGKTRFKIDAFVLLDMNKDGTYELFTTDNSYNKSRKVVYNRVFTINKKGKQIHKIACSEFWKGRESYRILQDKFYKYITDNGFDLERGKSTSIKHLSVEEYKKVTNYENIKCELQNEPIQEIDTTNMQLVLAQNKNLQLYNKKLKGYLAQTLKSIEKAITLEQENQNLIEENSQLHNENQFLKKYIDKAYDYISILINIPKLKIKNMIDNFFKELKEK